jgi:hypothetical protein
MDPATQNHFVELQSRLQISNVTMVNLCSTNHSSLGIFHYQQPVAWGFFMVKKTIKPPISWDPTLKNHSYT